jgi:hypothetical protein
VSLNPLHLSGVYPSILGSFVFEQEASRKRLVQPIMNDTHSMHQTVHSAWDVELGVFGRNTLHGGAYIPREILNLGCNEISSSRETEKIIS